MKSRYRLVLFDLDGTVLNSHVGKFSGFRYAFEKLGLGIPDEETMRSFIGPPLEHTFEHTYQLDPKTAAQGKKYFIEHFTKTGWQQNELYAGIKELIQQLHESKTQLAVVTGIYTPNAIKLLQHWKIDEYFQAAYGGDISHDKAKLISQLWHDRPELNQRPAVVIGDRKFDMQGGKAHDLHTIGVTYGYGDQEELLGHGAQELAHDVEQLKQLLFHASEPTSS